MLFMEHTWKRTYYFFSQTDEVPEGVIDGQNEYVFRAHQKKYFFWLEGVTSGWSVFYHDFFYMTGSGPLEAKFNFRKIGSKMKKNLISRSYKNVIKQFYVKTE